MTTRPPHPRPGLGLTEVLVALFVMALGLIGILTLFPIGAMSIAHGLKDDRCTETALQADGFLRAYWKANVVESTAELNNVVEKLTNPGVASGLTALVPATETGFSYPVMIDPIGNLSNTANVNVVVAANATPAGELPRCNLTPIPPPTTPTSVPTPLVLDTSGSTPGAFEVCGMNDDLTFLSSGISDPTRQGRYNWAAIVQVRDVSSLQKAAMATPTSRVPIQADFQVLVFDSRPPGLPLDDYEKRFNATSVKTGDRSITGVTVAVPPDSVPPLVRRGGWFMDGTQNSGTDRRADFYRITGVKENSSGNYDIDFDPPFRGPDGTATAPRKLYFFAGLVEVFQRPQLGTTPIR